MYEITQSYLPVSSNERNKQFEASLLKLRVTKKGEEGDCIVLNAKMRKSGERWVLHATETNLLQKVASNTGRQFKTHGDTEKMTITVWRTW
tara:strand:+ start:717 stop:989 length:273 start_codon:yes stop_codon:yes gene_type:complete